MTVAVEDRRVSYDADGVGPYAVPFPFFEIAVYLDGDLVDPSDYTIVQEETGGEGTVEFDAEPDGLTVIIVGETSMAQAIDYISTDDVEPESVERGLDRVSMIVQELKREALRGVSITPGSDDQEALDLFNNPDTVLTVDEDGLWELIPKIDLVTDTDVEGTLQALLDSRLPWVSVIDEGADPTGADDSRAAFQACVGNDRIILVPPGTYKFSTISASVPYPRQVLNKVCWDLAGTRNCHVIGYGATLTVSTAIGADDYLFMCFVTSPAQHTAGNFCKNVSVKGLTFQHNANTGSDFRTTVSAHSVDGLLVEDVTVTGDFSAGGDPVNKGAAFSSSLCRNVTWRRCTFNGMASAFDLASQEDLLIENCNFDGTINDSGTMIYAVSHSDDPLTSLVTDDYKEEPNRYDAQGYNITIRDNVARGVNNGFQVLGAINTRIYGNTIEGQDANSAAINAGIYVGTDDEAQSASLFCDGCQIFGNTVFGFSNSGAANGAGIIITTGSGANTVKNISIYDNAIYDNDNVGIRADLSIVNLHIGRNDFNSRDSSGVQTSNINNNYAYIDEKVTTANAPPRFSAAGSPTNIDLELAGKGTGHVTIVDGADDTKRFELSVADVSTGVTRVGVLPNASGSIPVVIAQSAQAQALTGSTAETTLATVTVPANSIGVDGRVRVTCLWSMTSSGNAKTERVKFGGTTYRAVSYTAVQAVRSQTEVANRSASSQIGAPTTLTGGGWGSVAAAVVTSAIDTTADVTLVITGQLADGADTLTLEAYVVEVLRGA